MEKKARLISVMNLQKPDRPPILGGWLSSPDAIQQICRISEGEYWQDPKYWLVQAEKALGSDGMMDALVPIHRGEFRVMDVHSLEERAQYSSIEMVVDEIMAMPDPEEIRSSFNEEAAYAEFIVGFKQMQALLGDMLWAPADWDVIPLALRYHRYGYENALTLPLLFPEVHSRMMRIAAEKGRQRSILHARAMREGIQAKCFLTGEDLCGQQGPMISPAFLRKEYWPLVEYAIEPLLEAGARLIWHCDGNVRPVLDDVLACGFAGFQGFQSECGVTIDLISQLKTQRGDPLIVFGPISVTTLLPFGTPQDVRAEVRRAMEVCRDTVSLIYFTSSSINPDVPLDNILAFWDEVLKSHW
ncbi:MAG: hypothetical protein IMZ62_01585 [Chloroflexi bacterium]|nr:hypothetical protein [Chloroflexota bacterium]